MNFRLLRRAAFILATVVLSLGGGIIRAQNAASPKAERFQQLMRKSQAGEALTPDEKAFVDEVRADIQRRRGGAAAVAPATQAKDAAAPFAGKWEELSDGSLGQETEFLGVGGVAIPVYVRKPKGDGPFPVIVLMHGGKHGKGATLGLGRSMQSPTVEFIKAGWAVYSADYRPSEKLAIVPIEFDDTVEAVKVARKLPFADPQRIGIIGGSHGGQVSSRVVSRVDVSGAVLCAPAAIDFIEIKKAAEKGEPVVQILKKMIADVEAQCGVKLEDVEKDPAKYGYSSAMTEADQVRCPILVINGRNDDNSPIPVIEAYAAKLRAAGKQVETYLPENGPHGFYFGRPDIPETKEAARLAVEFFQKQFAKAAASAAPASSSTSSAASAPAGKTKYLYGGGEMNWVDTDHSDAGDLKFKIFHSDTINGDVSCMIWLPPDYEKDEAARYPVLYELPASGGSPRRDTPRVAALVSRAIREQRIAPMIIVGVPALRGNTMYCDSRDGDYPLETVIIKDLIPHIDATYRTVASREGRAVDGFSMGGFGAAHLGFKFPEVFGVISIMAPPLVGPELQQPRPMQAWRNLFTTAMCNDLDYFRANDPFTLAEKSADALRDRTFIRIVAHSENEHWLVPQCEKLHQILLKNSVQHEFCVFTNVKGHSPNGCTDSLGDAAYSFFSSSLPRPKR